MHYWNQVNFEGLASLGKACSHEANLELFAQYCLMREQGQRKKAIEAAASFARFVSALGPETQREISTRLVGLQYANPGIHQLLPHPIKIVLTEISQAWANNSSADATPLVQLGLLTGDIEYFQTAIQLRPADQIALKRVAHFHLNNVEFQGHHLSESRFIGTIDEAHESLRHAEQLISRLVDVAVRDSLAEELVQLKLLISEWIAYCMESPVESFPQWASDRGSSFSFSSVVYYR